MYVFFKNYTSLHLFNKCTFEPFLYCVIFELGKLFTLNIHPDIQLQLFVNSF